MSDKEPPTNPFDPATWQAGRDAYLNAWAKAMVDAVNTDQYAKATGQMLDSYLSASHPLREVLEKSMTNALAHLNRGDCILNGLSRRLAHLNMPSSADVTALAERVTNIEMRLDDMDAKLDRIVKHFSQAAPAKPKAVAMKTKRTRSTKRG